MFRFFVLGLLTLLWLVPKSALGDAMLSLDTLMVQAQKQQDSGQIQDAFGTLLRADASYPDSQVVTRRLESLVSAGLPPILPDQWLPNLPVEATTLPYDLGTLIVPKAYLPTHSEEPQHQWKFSKVAYLYLPDASLTDAKTAHLFCTVHYPNDDSKNLALRLARLLAYAHQTLVRKTGREAFNGATPFNVWLCAGGQSGGEQWRDNLYLYDIDTPRSSIEWLREAVHEYSHLALPPIGGYDAPEYWANGYLGERLLVRWFLRRPDGPAQIEAIWGDFSGARNFDKMLLAPPLALYHKIGPSPVYLARKDEIGMRYFIGQALTFDDKYGSRRLGNAFSRLPRLSTATPKDFAAALAESRP